MHFLFTWTYWFVICCSFFYDNWSKKIKWYFQDQRNVFYRCSVTLITIAIIEFLYMHNYSWLNSIISSSIISFLHSHMIGCITIMLGALWMSLHFYPCYHKDLELYINLYFLSRNLFCLTELLPKTFNMETIQGKCQWMTL